MLTQQRKRRRAAQRRCRRGKNQINQTLRTLCDATLKTACAFSAFVVATWVKTDTVHGRKGRALTTGSRVGPSNLINADAANSAWSCSTAPGPDPAFTSEQQRKNVSGHSNWGTQRQMSIGFHQSSSLCYIVHKTWPFACLPALCATGLCFTSLTASATHTPYIPLKTDVATAKKNLVTSDSS